MRFAWATGAQEDWVWGAIADNGSGFDVKDARKRAGGRGLLNQARRSGQLGGEVLVTSDGTGTRVTLRLPLRLTD